MAIHALVCITNALGWFNCVTQIWFPSLWVHVLEYKLYREFDNAPIVALNVIVQAEPKNVMLVHGEAEKMDFLKQKIVKEFGNLVYL